MRKLLLLLCFAPALVIAKGTLSGKWIEVKRMKLDKTAVSFTDTIHLDFLIGNEYVWHKSGGFIYRGTFKVSDKDLDLGMRDFAIIKRTGDRMVLQDDNGIYELAPDHSVSTPQALLPQEKAPAAVSNINQMIGHWSVYKRTSDKTIQQVDYTRLVKMIDITGGSSDGKLGYVYASRDANNAPSWSIDKFENQKLYCSGKDVRVFNVLKCEDNDMILEENGITYFFRQFK